MDATHALSLVLSLTVGCSGLIGDPGGEGEGGGEGRAGGPGPSGAVAGTGHADAADGIRRLTNTEYRNTVAALFGSDLAYRDTLAPDTQLEGYDRVAEATTVSPAHIEGWARTAASIADAVLADDAALGRWLDCDVSILPPRGRTRSATQRGGDLVCSYNSNCYRPDTSVSYPNNANGSDPGVVYYDESVPAPGRYRVTIEAHAGGTNPGEPSVIALSHGALGEIGRLEIDGDTYAPYALVLEATEPGVQPMTIEWISPLLSPSRRVYIRTITLEGPIDDGADLHADARRACGLALADTLGERAFRRPLSSDERALVHAAFEEGARTSFWEGVRSVIELVLQSPQLLYVVETGTPVDGHPGFYALDDWELATRLALLAWEAPPDDALIEAARSGELARPEVLRAHAERLFADPRARATVQRFTRQWLELDEVALITRPAELFPEFTPALRDAMVEETRLFLEDTIWESGGGVRELLTSRRSVVTPELASIYGVATTAEGPARIELPAERRGLLTQPGILAAHSQSNQTSPVQRGVFVLERLLCVDLPPPPDSVPIVPPSVEDTDPSMPRTTRERWAAHSDEPACAGCHTQIDPVGFTFEAFDGIGRHRTEERGLPIDTVGGVPTHGLADGSIAGAAAMAEALADLPETADCLARQWLRFGLGRLERDTDAAALEVLGESLETDGILAMLVALVDTDAFRHRVVLEEVSR